MRRRASLSLGFTFLCVALLTVAANAWIILSTRSRIYGKVITAPANDVGLVLGTSSVTPGGDANPFFAGRIETAARLYDGGKVRHLLLSGDNHHRSYDEPEEMRKSLLEAGLPESALTIDEAGFRTLDSVARAKGVFGQSRLTIVTDDFHAARALFLADHFGLDAIAVCSRSVPMKRSLKTRLREIASRVKACLDVYVLHRQPRFLGPQIPLAIASPDFKTIDDRVAEFGEAVRERMLPRFVAAEMEFPPARIALVALKEERLLQLYAASAAGGFRLVHSFPVFAASGNAGPKLREGDGQVPEGIYEVELLHPNSHYHLALRVNYPNEFDRAQSEREGRAEPGTDIMIHGGDRSRGCLAVGDEAAEDLFVMAALAHDQSVPVIIAPADLRVRDFAAPAGAPAWTRSLYDEIRGALARFPSPAK